MIKTSKCASHKATILKHANPPFRTYATLLIPDFLPAYLQVQNVHLAEEERERERSEEFHLAESHATKVAESFSLPLKNRQ